MPITLKSRQQIALLRDAGKLVAETFEVLREHVVPGVTTAELDRLAEEHIRAAGAKPIYKGYVPRGARGIPPFPGTICASVNDVICHGIPSPKQYLRDGDLIGVDIGVILNGWVGDSCMTYAIGKPDTKTQRLMDVAKRAMELGIAAAQGGRHLGDIGAAIQQYAQSNGFSVVREYTGHGVGRNLHEEPTVLHYGTSGTGLRLKPGMVFTIEPMVNAGGPETQIMPDQWTVRTADGSRSAQFEHTIAITDGAPEILTLLA